jgi:multidrug resistance protein MdtO
LPLIDFLRRELTPTPGRLGATLRLTLACTAATVPIMIHHIPSGLLVMIVMYMVAKEDTTATLLGSVLSLLGVTLGLALALVAWQIPLETPWRLVFVFLFAAGGLYLGRIMVLGALGAAIGIPAAMGMVLPDLLPAPDLEYMTESVLWLWWGVVLGLGINLGVQLLLSPGDPLLLLRRALVDRLRAVQEVAGSLGRRLPHAYPLAPPSLTALTVAGTSGMLALLKMASLRHGWARQHRPELGALITLVDQLVTAAAALEADDLLAPEQDTRDRLEQVASACAGAARAVAGRSETWPEEPSSVEPARARAATVPALVAMERLLGEIALAMPRRAGPDSRQIAPEPARKVSLFVPDAFSNPEYARFAVRGGLACLICDVLVVGLAYPGIYTSVITCFVVGLPTAGASTQKGILRFTGAAVGGGMGIYSLIYILPHVETLGGFWLVFAAGTAVAGWVNFGSPRVSYGGLQIGVAFYKVVLQGFGPTTNLKVARDRLIGIALGLVVFGILEHILWPVRASDRRQERFADVLRSLAALTRLGMGDRTPAGWDRDLEDMRRRIAHGLAGTQSLLEESKFELRAGELEGFERSLGDAQIIFLTLLSLAYQRRVLGQPLTDLPVAARHLEDAVARSLEEIANRTPGRQERPAPDLDVALAAVERVLTSVGDGAPTGTSVVAVIGRRLELYRTLVRLVSQLALGVNAPVGALRGLASG